jgi:2-oxoglutarate ferredoxin oxidoreductase subunit gamma
MNLPSLEKYETTVKNGGIIVYNASLINRSPGRQGVRIIAVKANEVAESIGNIRIAANVMLGAYIEVSRVVSLNSALEALSKVLPPHRHKLIPENQKALLEGARIAEEAGLATGAVP